MKHYLSLLFLPLFLSLPSCISSNIGAALDSVGKAVPTINHKENGPVFYQQGNNYYMECEVRYMRYAPNLMDWHPDPAFWGMRTEYEEAPAYLRVPAPERYLLHLNAKEPALVRAADFDFKKAKRIKRTSLPKGTNTNIPISLRTGWHLLSADLLKENSLPAELSTMPEKRTIGNYMRTPLVPLISWGVDVPVSIAGSILSLSVTVPGVFVSVVICGERFY
ncbi:MAG: hypothetical protein II295_05045 [Akkermansia sp.]|nr:hypothetical protein [Akkermansia sp.]